MLSRSQGKVLDHLNFAPLSVGELWGPHGSGVAEDRPIDGFIGGGYCLDALLPVAACDCFNSVAGLHRFK